MSYLYISGKNSTTKHSVFTRKYSLSTTMRACYDLINRFVVQSAMVLSYNSQLINSVKLHRATSYAYSSWIKKTMT